MVLSMYPETCARMAICTAVIVHERPFSGRSALPSLSMKVLLWELQDSCSITLLHAHRLHCLCLDQTLTVIILNIEISSRRPHLYHKKALVPEEFVVRDVEHFEARCDCAELSAIISLACTDLTFVSRVQVRFLLSLAGWWP